MVEPFARVLTDGGLAAQNPLESAAIRCLYTWGAQRGARDLADIRAFLGAVDEGITRTPEEMEVEGEEAQPDVLFTSLVRSKGLSAEHVFIVGMNEGHFPRRTGTITDDEVCTFLVALSRTRKRSHVISDGFFGRDFLSESVFLSWIRPHLERLRVDKNYDFTP
ncbi:MAG TPA: hypothetical protein VLB81_03255 [Gaiellales bacterium]|nr:hypothetical protein [Gaiellales bacterium]